MSFPSFPRGFGRRLAGGRGRAASLFADPVAVGAVNALLVLALSAAFLFRSWMGGLWMALPHADVGPVDFAAFWASAKVALAGHAAQAYDWPKLQAVLEHAARIPVPHKLPIYYPPAFLMFAAPLGALPYMPAFALWVALGLAAYAAVVRLASRRASVMIVALASVGVFASAMVGQNGLFVAALLGGGLALTDRRPLLAGVLLGLLCCKPQFALLAPVALVAGGRWRSVGTAAVTVAVLSLMAGLTLGWGIYPAFLAAGAHARDSFSGAGWLPWAKVQTVYGALREGHLAGPPAFAVAGAASLVAAVAVAWLWRKRAPMTLRVAAACAGAFLATPYAFSYDAALLGMASAFLLADVSRERPLGLLEKAGLILAFLAPFLANPWPTTAPSAAILLVIAVWRARPAAARAGITEISPPSAHPSASMRASI